MEETDDINKNKKMRFASLSELEKSRIMNEREASNTKKATEQAVRVLRLYLTEKNLDNEFEQLSTLELDTILKSFFLEARSGKGELYKKTTLTALRHGINRHLVNCGRNIDIIKGEDFKNSQVAFKSMIAKLKEEGKGGIDHFSPLESADLMKLYDYFEQDLYSPERLQEKVFVDIMLHFGRRGRENIRDLKITDFWLTTDSQGSRYMYMKKDEKTKNHQDDTNTAKGEMHEMPGSSRCPIRSFVRYKKLLNQNCPYLFQRLNPSSAKCPFSNAPIGHNKLGSMMAMLSGKAQLSKPYTNHCLRATSVHVLDEAQIPTRHIMTVTGHKAETSRKTYTGYTDNNMKKLMSHTISASTNKPQSSLGHSQSKDTVCASNDQENIAPQCSSSADDINLSDFSLVPLTDSQVCSVMEDFSDTDFDDFIATLPDSTLQSRDSSEIPVASVNVSNRQLTCNYRVASRVFPQPVITGQYAQVTINYFTQ